MAKTKSTRQAEFRARMREESKQAVIGLAETALVMPLRVTKLTSKPAPVPLPVIPIKALASIVRKLTKADTLCKKKLAQIAKIQKMPMVSRAGIGKQ